MIEEERVGEVPGEDFVLFHASGEPAKGAFQCAECGYGVVVTGALPTCPMCAGTSWEEAPWRPFGRSGGPL